MSGDRPLKTGNERLKQFENILNEYIKTTGMNHLLYNPEVQGILSLTQPELRGMNAEECGIKGFVLAQYAGYIQKEQNRQSVRVKWATRELNLMVAAHGDSYGDSYTKTEIKQSRLINDNEAARVLSDIIKYAEARQTELDFLAGKVSMMGQALLELQKTKRGTYESNRVN